MLSVHFNYNLSHIQRNLQINGKANSNVIQKLASGFRINTAADDPAGLIFSEQLRSQIAGLERAIQNTNETNALMAITEGAMSQVANILQKMKNLAIHSANAGVTSPEQVADDQAQMDSALEALERIFGATNVAGRKILDNMRVDGRVPKEAVELAPANIVATPETVDRKKLYESLINGENMLGEMVQNTLLDTDGKLTEDRILILTGMGEDGGEEVQLSLKMGDNISDVLSQLAVYQQDLARYADSGEQVPEKIDASEICYSEDGKISYMSAQMLKQMEGMATEDAKALLGNYLGTFNNLKLGTFEKIDWDKMSEVDREMFKLSDLLQNMGLGSMGGIEKLKGYDKDGLAIYEALSLGDLWSGGTASLANDPIKAMEIIDKALKEAVQHRAAIGATMRMAQHSADAMAVELENVTSMESSIRDTDMSESMVEYARTQILTQVGTRLMSQVLKQNNMILDLLA